MFLLLSRNLEGNRRNYRSDGLSTATRVNPSLQREGSTVLEIFLGEYRSLSAGNAALPACEHRLSGGVQARSRSFD
jgi:hypothetical protein